MNYVQYAKDNMISKTKQSDFFPIFSGYKGNLSERSMALIVSMILGIPTLFIELFILLWQTYV